MPGRVELEHDARPTAKHLGAAAECCSPAGSMPCRGEPEHYPVKHLGAAEECCPSAGFMPRPGEHKHTSRAAANRGRGRYYARKKVLSAASTALARNPDHDPTRAAYALITDPNGTTLGDLAGSVLDGRHTTASAVADFTAVVAQRLQARSGKRP